MKLIYFFRIICKNLLIIKFLKDYEILGSFLNSDVQYFRERAQNFLKKFDAVMFGLSDSVEISGNGNWLHISSTITRITEKFSSTESEAESCTVETPVLRDILLAWIDEIERFHKIENSCESKRLDPDYAIYCLMASVFSAKNRPDIYLQQLTTDQKNELRHAIQKLIDLDELKSVKESYLQKCVAITQQENSLLSWLTTFFETVKGEKAD